MDEAEHPQPFPRAPVLLPRHLTSMPPPLPATELLPLHPDLEREVRGEPAVPAEVQEEVLGAEAGAPHEEIPGVVDQAVRDPLVPAAQGQEDPSQVAGQEVDAVEEGVGGPLFRQPAEGTTH